MVQQRSFVILVAVIYVILMVLFFESIKEEKFEPPCSFPDPCVRFCCKIGDTCNEKFIREKFNESLLLNYYSEDVDGKPNELKIFLGAPLCLLLQEKLADSWEFSMVM